TGTDVVIRYEDVEIKDYIATILVDSLKYRQNIHEQGEDRKQGSLIVAPPLRISSAEIGVAATIGKAQLQVAGLPKAIIISTGDELVEVSEQPLAHQIRRSNVHRLRATLRNWGLEADTAHLIDDEAVILQKLAHILEEYKIIIMSGGVSKGKFDFIPNALDKLGVKKLFHRIRQRPGKPFWFGKAPGGSIIFALPGNPVSSFMCTHKYFYPWLQASLGVEQAKPAYAILEKDVTFRPDLTYFVQVKTRFDQNGTILATPVEGHGSGDLANLVDADAFMELPQGKDLFQKGEVYSLLIYR
ncbi:MAG: molybdopterin molybdotransferase MoeA, partial [Bacteroidota bacterium]